VSSAGDAPSAAEGEDDGLALGGFLLALRARGLRDGRLLTAIENAPRAAFLPPDLAGYAYKDMSLPIACGQEATSPFVIADAVNLLDVAPRHRVLEVGAGSGWQTAILAGLARAVASLERFRALADGAERRLADLGVANAVVVHGDGAEGLPDGAPFDRIIVNGALDAAPNALMEQLAPDGALLIPLAKADGQFLHRIERGVAPRRLGASRLPRLARGAALAL